MKRQYIAAKNYKASAYRVSGWRGIAFEVLGWEVEPIENPRWPRRRTGLLVVQMIGDDRHFAVDPSDVTALADDSYCSECGQIGCGHGG